jgi:hypothetical protein
MSQRVIRGALEGAGIGFLIGGIRLAVKIFRGGVPEDLGAHVPEIIAFWSAYVIGCGYVFASGRGIADGLAGAFVGTLAFAALGIFAGSFLPYQPTGFPYPLLIGGFAGVAVGAPLGAAIQRYFTPRHTPPSQ